MRKSVTSPLNGFYLMKHTAVLQVLPHQNQVRSKSPEITGKGKSGGTKPEDAVVCLSHPECSEVCPRILCELQAARIRGGSKLTVLQHLQPRLLGLVRSAVNALRTFGNLILLCAQERKRQGKNRGDHSTQALSIQGVRRVYSFVLASP